MMPAGPAPLKSTWRDMLTATLYRNIKAETSWNTGGTVFSVGIPTKRPAYLVPPVSWLVRPPKQRVLQLDPVAADLWFWCDGQNRVEDVIDLFARKHALTFHEARVSVTGYLKELVKRGALAVTL
jgi:hypothetical protein